MRASELLAWVDFFLISCNSTCNQNCTNTSIVAGVFDLYIRENWYKKYRIAHACSRSKAPQQEIQLRLNTSGNARETTRNSTLCATLSKRSLLNKSLQLSSALHTQHTNCSLNSPSLQHAMAAMPRVEGIMKPTHFDDRHNIWHSIR